jgi:hypothetical protein
MAKRLFTLLAALSLLLCVAVLAVWFTTAGTGWRVEWGQVDLAKPSRTRYQFQFVGGQVERSRRTVVLAPGTDPAVADEYRRSFAGEDLSFRRERTLDVTRVVTTFDRWHYTTYPGHPVLRGTGWPG